MIRIVWALFLLAGLVLGGAAQACVRTTFKERLYVICAVNPARAEIVIRSTDAAGKPYGSFKSLAGDMWRTGKQVIRLAVNGGMYHEDFSPVGLLVEDGRQRAPVNRADAEGNFFLKPNGIFWLMDKRAGVTETGAFLAAGFRPGQATQSGPMLVIDGAIHPAFDPAGTSLKIRNGVGVDRAGRILFVTSEEPVRFHDLASLFRDVLACDNALFLDGTISSLMVPEWGRQDDAWPLGPIIAVVGSLP